jgi:hypothetical protein
MGKTSYFYIIQDKEDAPGELHTLLVTVHKTGTQFVGGTISFVTGEGRIVEQLTLSEEDEGMEITWEYQFPYVIEVDPEVSEGEDYYVEFTNYDTNIFEPPSSDDLYFKRLTSYPPYTEVDVAIHT